MKEFLALLRARPGLSAQLLAASLFVNVLALAGSVFVIQVLNRYVAHGVDATLATLTTGVTIAVVMEFLFREIRLRLAAAVSAEPNAQLSDAAYGALTVGRSAALDRLPPGRRQEILRGLDTIQATYTPTNIAAILDVPFALLSLGALLLLSPVLGMAAVLLTAVAFGLGAAAVASLRAPARTLAEASATSHALVATAVNASDMVRAANGGGALRTAWANQRHRLDALRQRIEGRRNLVQSVTQAIGGLMTVAVIAVGAKLAVSGEITVGALIGANILAARALTPVARFAQMADMFAKAGQAVEQVQGLCRLPMEEAGGKRPPSFTGTIEFTDVAMIHPGDSLPLFEGLSLRVEPGEVVGVTGRNGAGKTTLARMIVGLIDPVRGQILADGVDLRQFAPEWWRRQVSYVPQEATFFNATIEENLRIANPDLTEEDVWRLVSAADMREFLDGTPKGLRMFVADNGRHLPLGIRRRLALARALAVDGRVVVIDEPTEGLDAQGCAAIYAALNDLTRRGRTIIAFSHDPAILRGAHHAVDLNGRPRPTVTSAGRATVPAPAPEPAVPA